MGSVDIAEKHIKIQEIFSEVFTGKGFVSMPPEPMIPRTDTSVYFTGASITAFKPIVEGITAGKSLENLFMVQPCLRLQSMNRLLKEPTIEFHGYFNMLGGLCRPENEALVVEGLSEIFARVGGKAIIKASTEETGYYPIFEGHFPFELNQENAAYYRWKFGTPSFTGQGVTLALGDRDDQYADVGNFIRLYDSDGRHIASEIGFGIETICKAMTGATSASKGYAYHHIAIEKGLEYPHLIESVIGAVVVAGCGVQADLSKRGQILRKLCRNTAYVTMIEGIALKDSLILADSFIEHLNIDRKYADYVKEVIGQQYRQAIDNIKSVITMADKIDKSQPLKNIQAVRDKIIKASDGAYFIPDVFRDEILRSYGLMGANGGEFPYKQHNFLMKLIKPAPIEKPKVIQNGPC